MQEGREGGVIQFHSRQRYLPSSAPGERERGRQTERERERVKSEGQIEREIKNDNKSTIHLMRAGV